MRKKGFVLFPLLISGLVIIVFLLMILSFSKKYSGRLQMIKNISQTSLEGLIKPSPTPTPFPFQEMTIPYLRETEFESRLGQMTQTGRNANYTSYVTSYMSDGFKINGFLTVPVDGSKKHPAIVFIHGYVPPENYQTRENYATYVDYFAKNGFVVFKIDLRGHADSEGEAGGGYYSADYVIDTLNAYSALENADFVDKEKIGLWGHSMAGNIVFRALVAKKDIPAAVVWAGAGYTYADLQDYAIDDNSYRPPPEDSDRAKKRQLFRDTYGSFDPEHAFWKQVTPVNYLDGVKSAIQVNHAIDDAVVSIEYSRNLMKVLEDTGIYHELHEYSSGGHNLTGSAFTAAMQKSVEFFRNYL